MTVDWYPEEDRKWYPPERLQENRPLIRQRQEQVRRAVRSARSPHHGRWSPRRGRSPRYHPRSPRRSPRRSLSRSPRSGYGYLDPSRTPFPSWVWTMTTIRTTTLSSFWTKAVRMKCKILLIIFFYV